MTITKLSLQMPCKGPITIAGIVTLHGKYTTSHFLRCHGPPFLAMTTTTTNMRSRAHGELHQIIYTQASRRESDKSGNIGTGFKPGKLIIGVVIGLCVIGVMSRRYEAQMMSPLPNFASASQVIKNLMDRKRDGSIDELNKLMQDAIKLLKAPPADSELEKVKDASGEDYSSTLKVVDEYIKTEQYEKADQKLHENFENLKASTSTMDSSIELREYIILIGQAKKHLERYIKETKSLQRKSMDDLISQLTRVVIDEFKTLENIKIESEIDAFLKGEDFINTKMEGKDAFQKFINTMKSAKEKFKVYEQNEKDRRGNIKEEDYDENEDENAQKHGKKTHDN